mgnify:CR=1 FL=1
MLRRDVLPFSISTSRDSLLPLLLYCLFFFPLLRNTLPRTNNAGTRLSRRRRKDETSSSLNKVLLHPLARLLLFYNCVPDYDKGRQTKSRWITLSLSFPSCSSSSRPSLCAQDKTQSKSIVRHLSFTVSLFVVWKTTSLSLFQCLKMSNCATPCVGESVLWPSIAKWKENFKYRSPFFPPPLATVPVISRRVNEARKKKSTRFETLVEWKWISYRLEKEEGRSLGLAIGNAITWPPCLPPRFLLVIYVTSPTGEISCRVETLFHPVI